MQKKDGDLQPIGIKTGVRSKQSNDDESSMFTFLWNEQPLQILSFHKKITYTKMITSTVFQMQFVLFTLPFPYITPSTRFKEIYLALRISLHQNVHKYNVILQYTYIYYCSIL